MAGTLSLSCESGVEQMTKPCYRDGFGAGCSTVTCSTQENSFLCEHFHVFMSKLTEVGVLPILSITALPFHSFAHLDWKVHLILTGNSKHVLFLQKARNNSSLLSNHKVTAGRTTLSLHLESGGSTRETTVWFLLPSNTFVSWSEQAVTTAVSD